jgi:heat shock protein HslJ
MRRFGLVFTLLVALSVAAMSAAGCEPSEPPQDPSALENTRWEAIEFVTEEGMATPSLLGAMEGRLLTLELGSEGGPSGTASGSGGVNTFTGQWSADEDGVFELGPLAATKMAGPLALMDQEAAYLAALDSAESYSLTGDVFELLDGDGEVVVSYRPAAPALTLEGTVWRCTGYNNGQDAFVSVVSGSEITTEFEGSGSGAITGSSGVNDFSGEYTLDGSSLTISSAVATTQTEGPADLMDQESAYLAMLPLIETYKIVGETLTVYGAEDLRLAMYEISR